MFQFIETFPYPDGLLVGNGNWVVDVGDENTLTVSSHTVITVGGSFPGADNTSPLLPPSWSAPWQSLWTITPVVGDDSGVSVNISIGTESDASPINLRLQWNAGDMAASNMALVELGTSTAFALGENLAWPTGATKVVGLNWDGATVIMTFDGVVALAILGSVATATKAVQYAVGLQGGTTSATLSEIQIGY